MIDLAKIQTDLVLAMKAKDQTLVEVLRGLKTRIQNEQVAKMSQELSQEEIVALIRSELKKRKEAAEAFGKGGNTDAAEKELREAGILQSFLPRQMSEEELSILVKEFLAAGSFSAGDFGKVMGQLKAKVGSSADGALLSKVLKENLNNL